LRELAEAGALRGRVLDAGCGTGEHTLMAAALGCAATGVDQSGSALDQARRKAAERGLAARFEQRDVLELAEWGERFDVVLDSLVFHALHGEQRRRYVAGLGAVLGLGGRLFVLCYAEEPPSRGGPQHAVTPNDVTAAFTDGWRIDALDAVTVATTLPSLPDGLRGLRACLTRTGTVK
jgi:SAM-dependent methyltransferase